MLKYETPIIQLAVFSSEDVLTESWTGGMDPENGGGDVIGGNPGDIGLKLNDTFKP
ncbi:MAG: hypothetical protein PHT58_08450 [Eubacteriales bacterium]|nr:hypothetical protein [Eubacteriales bacterium]